MHLIMSSLFIISTHWGVHEDVDERVPEDGGLGHLQGEHGDQQRDGGAVAQYPWHQASIFCMDRGISMKNSSKGNFCDFIFFACKILSEPDACKGEGGVGRPAEEEDSDQSKHLQVTESREKYFLRLSEKIFEDWCYEKFNECVWKFYTKFCFE